MHTLTITDEMAHKLHTMYEHIDEHKHYVYEHNDIDIACDLAESYCKQEEQPIIETYVDDMKAVEMINSDNESSQTYIITVTLTPEENKILYKLMPKKLKIRIL